MDDCIFCRIVAGEIPGDIVYQDDELIAFRDIEPQAPVHLLIVPRRHIPSLAQLADDEILLIGRMAGVANRLARQENIVNSGYRLVINSGKEGGQIVPHLHLHVLPAWGEAQLSFANARKDASHAELAASTEKVRAALRAQGQGANVPVSISSPELAS